jgi:hypothetical protein
LQHLNKIDTPHAAWDSVHLAYNLSGGVPRFKLSLEEKLNAVALTTDINLSPVSLPSSENPVALTFPFLTPIL